ncbi:CCA tRNA nucleotidyltransferase [Paenibacillus sp. M1]|uniref:CCA tRNA nucleotidyltransferase n=1 Tax=Paenibacillus haidiansis TaxID=1574488 RepID=A0ABU7VLJ7_9BACL
MNSWKMVDPLMRRQGENVLKRLRETGFQAYFVGGCVRDELMGRPVHDMDIATSAKPEEVIALFDRTVPTGIQHGTVTVLMNGQAFEVTTFRKEAEYEDHRHPSSVEFVEELTSDLRRRDFTMNAMACDESGRITDVFGGRRDIEAGVIRCVGDAAERFDEDALRMMRAVRFASVFAFRPAKSLWAALRGGRAKIAYIAMERIRAELEKIVLGPYPLRGLALLQRSGLLESVKAPVPQAALTALRDEGRLTLLNALESFPPDAAEIRWSLLLQALGVPGEEAAGLMKKWTFSNAAAQGAADLLRFDEHWNAAREGSDGDLTLLRRHWIELELRFGKKIAASWLDRRETLLRSETGPEAAIGRSVAEKLDRLRREEGRWHRETVVHTLGELAVTGGDILQYIGRKGGPWLGELMKELLFEVASGQLDNQRERLLEFAKVVVNEDGA